MTKKILCPVDFSEGSKRALAKAEELARALGAEVELFHAYQLPVLALPDAPVTVSPAFITDLTDRAERALAQLLTGVREHGVPGSTHIAEGNPAEAIVARANEIGAHMIIMGTHGRGGFRHLLLGSIAERVVRMATVPVLTVHAAEQQ
jgi:nucleotide-binding universal stress UspA family protein